MSGVSVGPIGRVSLTVTSRLPGKLSG